MIDPENPPTRSHSPSEPTGPSDVSLSFHPDESHVGRYRLRRLLGKGGFGEVYLARDEELNRPVAIKIPHSNRITGPSDVEAYLAEARVTAQLDHPRIVPVYDFGRTCDGRCFIVSKYIEGTSLAQRLRGGRLGREEAIELVAAIAEALHHAHLQGIVHRDVKPGNILLDAAGNPYLTDFGLALREGDVGASPQVVGTISYTSPEQARGEGHRVDGRSDVFSLCVVLYELLTGRRPFVGKDTAEVLDRVITMEPRPLRQLDDTIPKELERICLKGLSKRVAERYSAARDVADELRSFLEETPRGEVRQVIASHAPIDVQSPPPASESNLSPPVRIVPKGLRAYDAEDADFFLELLPGPRDRQGLPPSLLFWKQRIEAADPDQAFSVGVMYGPSGCGKTSIVRAGLLPRLADHVRAVLCEADAATTEARLLGRLRFVCPGLPHDLGLKESLTAIRRDPRMAQGKKVLLVLDQFEQWLHAHRPEERSELVQSLRQCDGRTVACLILVRDDFWLAISRFLRELEVPLVEGQNGALVDLFDTRHARKVLRAMGQAFGALSPEKLTRQESAFVDQAVAGLAENDRVVCVRLSLFAEMMRSRPWTPASLRSIGGVTAVGARFLEETFAASTAPPEHRLHEKAARAVLESLLPEEGSQIKGRMRSYAELLHASGYAARGEDFRRLLQILDRELRLITPAERDTPPGEGAAAGRPAEDQSFHQLTHDYLVPSLREWLEEKRSRTIRGRAELCLAERSRRWQADPDVRQLPSWWEWIRIGCLTRRSAWSQPQQRLMRTAGRRYLWRAAMLGAAAAILFAAGMEVYGRYRASDTVDRLLSAETADAPDVVRQLGPYYRWAGPRLAAVVDDPDADPRKRLHAGLALLRVDPGQSDLLRARLLDSAPDECRVISEALAADGEEPAEEFWALLADSNLGARARFRAACALAAWAPTDRRWSQHADAVAAWLVSENSLVLGRWLEILRPVARSLVGPLENLFTRSDRHDVRSNATTVLAEYRRDDWEQLLSLGRTARPPELAVLAGPLKRHASRAVAALRAELAREFPANTSDSAKEALAKERAQAGILLCLTGAPEAVWPYLAQAEDPRVRTCLVHGLASGGVDPPLLVRRLAQEKDPSVRRAILWSLGKYEASVLTRRRCEELEPRLADIYRDDPDPGIHSAAEWLLRTWGYAESRLAESDAKLKGQALRPDRDWYVTSQGHTMTIVRGPVRFLMGSPPEDPTGRGDQPIHDEVIGRSFAVSTKEVTLRQYRQFAPAHLPEQNDARSLDLPVGMVSVRDAMDYCQWLNGKEGLPEDATCYVAAQDGSLRPRPDLLARTGYRLATEAEWEYACRAGTTTRRHFGHSAEFFASYAWYAGHGDGLRQPVGVLLPNDLGMFDMYGNVAEWCQDPIGTTADEASAYDRQREPCVYRGGDDTMSPDIMLRSSARAVLYGSSRNVSVSFRIARTIPQTSNEKTKRSE